MHLPEEIEVQPLGEEAFILRNLGGVPAHLLAGALNEAEGVEEATPAYETVGVYVREGFDEQELREALRTVKLLDSSDPVIHEVPVCYELGPDLGEAASALGVPAGRLVELHSGCIYTCHAIGFSPGFPFLGYLPAELSGLPRRSSPRQRVPAGSVGITGRQTGIYPSETPGGWNLIGRTPLCLVDLDDAYFPIKAGDQVRFVPIDEGEFERRLGERL